MKLATTMEDFRFYFSDEKDRLAAVAAAGFRYVDFGMYTWNERTVYLQDDWRNAVAALQEHAKRLGVTFVQAHSPAGEPLSTDEAHVDYLLAATRRSIEVCGALGIPNLVVHPGKRVGLSKEQSFEENRKFYRALLPTAEECGVNLLTENSCAVNLAPAYYANTGKDMVEFLRYVDHPQLHACWDTGHANCEGPQYDEILALGKDLYAIHYNDNRGEKDEHLLPFMGTMNHDEVMHALIAVGFKGPFTLECAASLRRKTYWQGNRRDFHGDCRLDEAPLAVQQALEVTLYQAGKHILSAYDLFEE